MAQVKEKRFYFGMSTILLIIGLIATLVLLKIQIDREKTQEAKELATQSLTAPPKNPKERVDTFIENIEGMPRTTKRQEFIDIAKTAREDNDISAIEYNQIKRLHHELQDEAIDEISDDLEPISEQAAIKMISED